MFGYGRVFVRAEGTRLWDSEGREYLDALAGFGATNLGHRHPALRQALAEELAQPHPDLLHIGPSTAMAELASQLTGLAGPPLEVAMFSTSGGEAVESALKLARAATRRSGFVYCEDGFHGTGLGALSVMGAERMRAPFEPLLQDCQRVPFGDLAALEKALNPQAAAFLVEPIQGEGGVRLPEADYLAQAQRLCRANGSLLLLDEVQTGLGRTGGLFAFQGQLEPDVVILGKALGGGILPVSACLTSRDLHQRAYGTVERFDLHGSTFSGYALGCAAARASLKILADEGLVENARDRGRQLLEGLQTALDGHPLVRQVRGQGLLVGIELGVEAGGLKGSVVGAVSRNVFGQWLAVRLLERGIICQPAALRWDVLKLEPPLTISPEEVERLVDEVVGVLSAYRELTPLLRDVGKRLGRQFLAGWKFPD
ncbi:MAG: aspartate aminotransferase family protein [Candidatus Eremiobacteraeota bacterium]|nr:aspartate aminotransferase family protein [Candidatus Eremiobacteraeota bacterium]